MIKPALEKLGILSNQNFIYLLLALFFIAYLLTGFWAFGALVGVCILWAVALEFLHGTGEHGFRKELKETAIALLLALSVWFGAGFLLQTPSPLNAIVSCSMLPHVQRGDMVVLSGDRIQSPLAEVPSISGIGNAKVHENGEEVAEVQGSLYAYCTQSGNGKPLCRRFVAGPENFTERQGALTFGYGNCEIVLQNGLRAIGPCASWVEIGGKKYYEDISNDVVVYPPEGDEYYSMVGDIIHRAFVKLQTPDGQVYFLTKGDNNPVFDIQVYDESLKMGNRPVEVERSKGRILFSVPYVGYLKLFISPSAIMTPEGCDRHYAKYDAS